MPLNIDSRDRKIMLGAAALLVALVVLAGVIPGENPDGGETPSSYSTARGGAKAAYLLLAESGYNVSRWTNPPRDLPSGKDARGTTLVLANPDEPASEEERKQLATFVNSGGRVLATGMLAAMMLPEGSFQPAFMALEVKHFPALTPSPVTRDASEITMRPYVRIREMPKGHVPLYGDNDGVVVAKYQVGAGEVIWWAGATPLVNASLRDADNVQLLLNCVGDRASTRILWDEFYHGSRQGIVALLAATPLPWAVLQVGVVLLVAIVTYSRRSGPVYEPAEPSRLSPLEYVQTLGGVYRRAKANEVAVQIALERFRYQLARKLGLDTNATPESVYQALRTRWRFEDEHFVSVLHECASARFEPTLSPQHALRMIQALQEYARKLKLTDVGEQD
jgi:hypothetical protein